MLALFLGSGLLALAIAGIVEGVLLHRGGVEEAVRDAQTTAEIVGHAVVEPLVDRNVMQGDQAALAQLDVAVREHLLGGPIVRVKVWSPAGRVLYSDEPRLIGQAFPLDEEDLAVLANGGSSAEVTDLTDLENIFERGRGSLVEVYVGLRSTEGDPLLFEAYFQESTINAQGRDILWSLLPALLVGLVVLELVQLPLVWSLGRRLWRSQEDRMTLLRMALSASDIERRRLAGAIHDGVMQKLTGLSYSLQAKATRLAASGPAEAASVLEQAAADTQANVLELRATLVEIYPPDIARAGLEAVLSDLAAPLAARGIDVRIDLAPDLELTPEHEALVFRASRETLGNILQHARAHTVRARVSLGGGRLLMAVEDDGVGFTAGELQAKQAEGHFGLRLLRDLVTHAGGSFSVESGPGGTTVRLEVPVQ